ncbi:MAG: hypothetical protein ACPL7R_06240 [Anaerolineae bacterium]
MTPHDEAVARRITGAYWEGAGFRLVSETPVLVYQRGSATGSMFGFSPKKWQARASVQFTPSPEAGTNVFAVLDVNTTGQWVTKRERGMLESEMDGLVAALGGMAVAGEGAVGEGQRPALQQVAASQEQQRLERQCRSGANWFYWIAGLSVINTLVGLFGGRVTFLIGLGFTQLVDGIVQAMATIVSQDIALVVRIVGLVVNVGIAVLFVVFGALANQRRKWAFIVGMALYALDGLLFIWVQDWWSFGFHLLALYALYTGFSALRQLAKTAG